MRRALKAMFVVLAIVAAVFTTFALLAIANSRVESPTPITRFNIEYTENKEFAQFHCRYNIDLERFELTVLQLESEGYELYAAVRLSHAHFVFRKVNIGCAKHDS